MRRRCQSHRVVVVSGVWAAVFLLIGAAVNVAVAWGCATLSTVSREVPNTSGAFAVLQDAGFIPTENIAEFYATGGSGFGVTISYAHARSIDEVPPFGSIHYYECGWPLRSLAGAAVFALSGDVEYMSSFSVPAGIGPIPLHNDEERAVPLQPLWQNFLLNSLLFASILWFTSRRYVLGWILLRDRGRRIQSLSPAFHLRKLAVAVPFGAVFTIVFTWLYALTPPNMVPYPEGERAGGSVVAERWVWAVIVRETPYNRLVQSALYSPYELGLVSDGEPLQYPDDTPSAADVMPTWAAEALRPDADAPAVYVNRFAWALGWPMPAMWYAHHWTGKMQLDPTGGLARDEAYGGINLGTTSGGYPKSLPTRIIWPGFGVNTLMYGSVIYLLLVLRALYFRFARRARGLCQSCAYDLRGADHGKCPECGEAVVAK